MPCTFLCFAAFVSFWLVLPSWPGLNGTSWSDKGQGLSSKCGTREALLLSGTLGPPGPPVVGGAARAASLVAATARAPAASVPVVVVPRGGAARRSLLHLHLVGCCDETGLGKRGEGGVTGNRTDVREKTYDSLYTVEAVTIGKKHQQEIAR